MSLDGVKVRLVQTIDEAAECSRWLSEQTSVAIDTETEGFDPRRDRVRLVQLGSRDVAYVLPIEQPRSWGGLALELLGRFTGRIVAHNLKFDYAMIECSLQHRMDVSRLDDTMLMSRVLDPLRSAALKRLSSILVDSRASVMDAELADAMKASGYSWHDVPLTFDRYWFYAGIDTILTYRVDEVLRPRLAQEQVTQAYDLELATSMVCGRMEQHGARIDVPYAREAHERLQRYVDETASWCQRTYDVKPGANAAVIQRLEKFGYTFDRTTRMGAKALDKEVLAGIDHPLAKTVLQRRQAQKIASTYLKHFVYDVDGDDRIHPRINSCEARTGRMSMDSPNLQNLPRRDENNPLSQLVRNCFVSTPGNVLMMCDFDQVEMRLFASLSEDPDFMGAFDGEVDIFTEMCRQIFNDPSITKDDPRRQITKNAGYARIYGAGNDKFATTAGITADDARQFNALLDRRYPALRRQQQRIEAEARANMESGGVAFVRSPLTNRRLAIDDDALYKLTNYKVQGLASEVLKLKLIQLDQSGLGDFMIAPVHDEVIMDVPRERADEVAVTVLDVMNDDRLFPVKITASLSYGDRWGTKSVWRPGVIK